MNSLLQRLRDLRAAVRWRLVGLVDFLLRELAKLELSRPSTGENTANLADRWWDLADEDRQHRRQLRLRAAYWYLRALDRLGANVTRVRAEVRVKEAEGDYGADVVRDLGV